MAAQIKTCFERYEKKYRLTAERQRAIPSSAFYWSG